MRSFVSKSTAVAMFGGLMFTASAANATIVTTFDTVPAGESSFDATVTSAGGTVSTQVLTSGVSVYADFTTGNTPFYTYPEITGALSDIAPAGDGTPQGTRGSGVTYTFATAINSFGLNVGDWGTCCQPSALFIAFDGGAPIQVGISTTGDDVPLTNGEYSIFVAAFDDSGSFTKVEFWGNGLGEALYGGGTIRYALLDQGSLPAVPEPATWAMMIGGFGMVGGALRRRAAAKVSFA